MSGEPKHNFAPSCIAEEFVFGAERPGYCGSGLSNAIVDEWCDDMIRQNSISAVVCLLPNSDIKRYYQNPLISQYRTHFPPGEVKQFPCDDYGEVEIEQIARIFEFLRQKKSSSQRVVVHCSAGYGRTGMVMTAWNFVEHHKETAREAVEDLKEAYQVSGAYRNPYEAYGGESEEAEAKLQDWLDRVVRILAE